MRIAIFLGCFTLFACGTPAVTDNGGGTDVQNGVDVQFGTDGSSKDSSDVLQDSVSDGSGTDVSSETSSDTVSDSSGDSPDVPVSCPGAPGCSCGGPSDCADTLCIDTDNGKRCAAPCNPGCEKGFACAEFLVKGAKKSACVPAWGKLCQPCNASADCNAPGAGGTVCVAENEQGNFCGFACSADTDCAGSYTCQIANSTEGTKSKQCVKVPNNGQVGSVGVCSCTPASKAIGASTQCYANQKDSTGKVVGKCPGTRICGPTGLGDCILTALKPDVCDGIDTDCNGKVDDNATGCESGQSCVDGKCTGGCSKVDGGWTDYSYTACSVTCGGGTRTGTRTCTNPAPACGGAACVGSAQTTESCNTQSCSNPGPDLPKGTSSYSIGGQVVTGNVPAGVTSMSVELWGAGGGGCNPGSGGGGGWVKATIAVTPGDAIELRVGGAGGENGGGGGMSFLSKNGGVLVIAGGGGGAGCDGCSGCFGTATTGAGGGGGPAGGNGQDGSGNNYVSTNSGGGGGGSQSSGGAGGSQNNASIYTSTCIKPGFAGSANTGGGCSGGYACVEAAKAISEVGGDKCIGNGTGGAGGAGKFGGGSGGAMYTYTGGGGGGGSSWVDGSFTTSSTEGGNFASPGGVSSGNYNGSAGKGGEGVVNSTSLKPHAGVAGLVVITL